MRLDVDKNKKLVPRRKWKKSKKGIPPNFVARACAINNTDSLIVIGMMDGSLWTIKCDNTEREFTWALDKFFPGPKKKGIAYEISDIKFSPDG